MEALSGFENRKKDPQKLKGRSKVSLFLDALSLRASNISQIGTKLKANLRSQ